MRAPFRGQSVAWIVNKSGTKSVEIATFTSLIILLSYIPSRERVQLSPIQTCQRNEFNCEACSRTFNNSNHGTAELLESDSRSLPLFSQHWHYPPKCLIFSVTTFSHLTNFEVLSVAFCSSF